LREGKGKAIKIHSVGVFGRDERGGSAGAGRAVEIEKKKDAKRLGESVRRLPPPRGHSRGEKGVQNLNANGDWATQKESCKKKDFFYWNSSTNPEERKKKKK